MKTKNISDYLEGIEEGELVPSIRGIIRKVKFPASPEEVGKPQIITIQSEDDSDRISLHFKNHLVKLAEPGDMLSVTASSPSKKTPSTGLVLKTSKTTGKNYIVVTVGAEISHTKEKDSVTETEAEEPVTAADSTIDNYILDRLYIFKRATKLIDDFNIKNREDLSNDFLFPMDKAPEIATAVHIELSRRNIAPRPDANQLERKAVHKSRTTSVPANTSVPEKANWKSFVHPLSGVKLGDEPVEKIGTNFAPWALKTDRDRLEKKMQPFHDAVMEAIEDLGLEYQDILDTYIVSYIHGQEKETVKRKILTKRFDNGLVEHGYVKKLGEPTSKEALNVLRLFPKIWKQINE